MKFSILQRSFFNIQIIQAISKPRRKNNNLFTTEKNVHTQRDTHITSRNDLLLAHCRRPSRASKTANGNRHFHKIIHSVPVPGVISSDSSMRRYFATSTNTRQMKITRKGGRDDAPSIDLPITSRNEYRFGPATMDSMRCDPMTWLWFFDFFLVVSFSAGYRNSPRGLVVLRSRAEVVFRAVRVRFWFLWYFEIESFQWVSIRSYRKCEYKCESIIISLSVFFIFVLIGRLSKIKLQWFIYKYTFFILRIFSEI